MRVTVQLREDAAVGPRLIAGRSQCGEIVQQRLEALQPRAGLRNMCIQQGINRGTGHRGCVPNL